MKLGFVVSTFIALVLVTIVTLYAAPLGLRGYLSEGFQANSASPSPSANNAVMNLKMARANMASEGFQDKSVIPTMIPSAKAQQITKPTSTSNVDISKIIPSPNAAMMATQAPGSVATQGFQNMNEAENQGSMYRKEMKEGFRTNYAEVSGGAKDQYQPIGAFDGVTLPTGNKVSSWRHTAPDEPLLGAPFKVGDDALFMFKNNQCKPECCGSSFSCSGGCVCTTPEQRGYINGRGGNRTAPADD